MIRAGVRVYLYQKGFLHSKTLVCDDTLMSCGSTNIDFRSFERNFEVNAFVYDKEAALHMKKVFQEDQSHCRMLNLETWGDALHLVPCGRILYSFAVSFALKKEKVHTSVCAMFFERRMCAEVIGFAMLQHEQAVGFQQVVPEHEVRKDFRLFKAYGGSAKIKSNCSLHRSK